MAENGGQNLEDAVQETENAPEPAEAPEESGSAGAATAETPTAGAEDGGSNLLRSVYRARSAAAEASSTADFSQMETADEGGLVRGAYLKHLAEGQGEAAGEHDRVGEDLLRRAYLAHMGAEPKLARARAGAAPAKKGAAKKRPARAATRGKAKAKRRPQRKARAARTGRGKRPRR